MASWVVQGMFRPFRVAKQAADPSDVATKTGTFEMMLSGRLKPGTGGEQRKHGKMSGVGSKAGGF